MTETEGQKTPFTAPVADVAPSRQATGHVLALVAATWAAVITYGCVRGLEVAFVRLVGPAPGEMRSLSHVILTTAFGVAIYLWLDLRDTRATLTALERDRIVVETQLALAAQVQQRLLPSVPASLNHVRWASRLKPAGKIGGDFYDFIPTGHDSTLVLIGDVSGKGMPAALLQASTHSLFRTLSRETNEPAALLGLVSREIYAENGGALYVTCLVMRVDVASGPLTYANAGHPTGLLLGRAGRRLLGRGGPPAGMFADTVYQSEMVPVEAGDLGVLVTDGITEAIERDGVSAVDRLDETISDIPLPLTPERVCNALMALAEHGCGPLGVSDWQDDKTVLVFLSEGDHDSVKPASVGLIVAEPYVHV
jgi:hypothetical protein